MSNYRLERLLGAGGMGSVHLARDLSLDRPVAIKFIAPEKAGDAAARRRLVREARAAAALEHPNICGVLEVIDEPGGRACIVMQYVEGQTLAELLREGPLEVRLALSLAADLASALAAAHRRGIIHRDLKPQNVIVTPERRAKLLDFGLARHADLRAVPDGTTTTNLTAPGAIAGTPPYMSPEQARQLPVDARSDLFALGAVLFECLTGVRAFTGSTTLDELSQVLHHEPPPVSALRAGLTTQHDELCRRLLAKHPDDRFQSAEEVLGALRVLLPESAHAHPAVGDGAPWSGATTRGAARLSDSALAMAGFRPFRARRAALVAVAMLTLPIAAAAFAGFPSWWRTPAPRSPAIVIGVLPFGHETGNADDELLAAGLPAALGSRLESLPMLRVLPLAQTREAVREGADPAAVARSLGAAFVVDGALARSNGVVEVRPGLVGPDGRRRTLGPYVAAGNPLDLHRRIAEGIAAALGAEGVAGTSGEAAASPTRDADAFMYYSQARLFLERTDVPGNADHAISLFRRAIERDRQFALAHAGLAEAYWQQFRETRNPEWTGRALAANLDALRIDPNQAEVRLSLGVMYSGQGRHDDAVAEANKVLELQPENDDAHRLLSDIHIARSEWDAAAEAAQRAIALRPSYWRNHNQLAQTYYRAGRLEDAERAYRRLIELQPDSARGYQGLGTVLQAAGRNDEALEKYEEAISIRPSAFTLSNVGTLYFWRGNYEKAAEVYEKAVALNPNTPSFHGNLGDAYARLGLAARAAEAYRRAAGQAEKLLAVNENDAAQLAALARYRAKLGERTAAGAAIARALAARPADRQVLYTAAIVHALAGDRRAACDVLGRALENGASTEEIRRADELRPLKGCAAYERVMGDRRNTQEE